MFLMYQYIALCIKEIIKSKNGQGNTDPLINNVDLGRRADLTYNIN